MGVCSSPTATPSQRTRCGRWSSNGRSSIALRSATPTTRAISTSGSSILHLRRLREADGLGSFLGGRVRLFPHQLHVAERATQSDPVRWLLADEVGLGKTIEACLDPQPPRAHAADRTLPRGGAGVAHGAVAGRAVAQVPPGVHAARRAAPRRRRARLRRGLQSVRAAPPRRHRARDADRAARAERAGGRGGHRSARRRRSAAAAPAAGTSRRAALARDCADRGARPSRAALERHAARRRRPRVLPAAAAPPAGGVSRGGAVSRPGSRTARRCRRAPARRGASTSAGCRRGSASRSTIEGAARWQLREDVEAALRAAPAANEVARRQKIDRIRRALASGAALAAVLGPAERDASGSGAGDGRLGSARRVAGGAGAALARREGEDAGLRRAPRDARDAADRAQPSGAAGHGRLPRGAAAVAARHRGGALPRARRAQPARLHRGRRRGAQLRVLPAPGAVRSAVEAVGRRAAHRTARSHRAPRPGRDRLLPAAARHRRRRRAVVRNASVSSASRWPAWSRSWPGWKARSPRSPPTRHATLVGRGHRLARRRGARGAHAHSRSGVSAAAPRSVQGGDGAGAARARAVAISTR